jgi:hypothetical protein
LQENTATSRELSQLVFHKVKLLLGYVPAVSLNFIVRHSEMLFETLKTHWPKPHTYRRRDPSKTARGLVGLAFAGFAKMHRERFTRAGFFRCRVCFFHA